MEKAIELKLTLPAAPIEYLASLEEATTHCKSGVSILLIPQVEAGMHFLTSSDLAPFMSRSFICAPCWSCNVEELPNLAR